MQKWTVLLRVQKFWNTLLTCIKLQTANPADFQDLCMGLPLPSCSLDHSFVMQLPRESPTAFKLPRVFHSSFFSSVGVQLLWQNATFYRIWWCLYCKQSGTCWCECCDFSLDKADHAPTFMNVMKHVGVVFLWSLICFYFTFLGLVFNCFSECC